MNWLERMNWTFLDDDTASRVWDKARRLFFEDDEKLDDAFKRALKSEGFVLEETE